MSDDASLLEKVARLVRRVAPELPYLGTYTYTVSRDNGSTLDLVPAPGIDHPPHLRVEQRAAPGIEAGLANGDEVLIVFRQPGNRPAIIGHAPLNASAPGSLKIDTTATGIITIGATSSAVNIGGGSAVPLAKAAPIVAWAALVVTALSVLGQTVPALSAPATTKAKGV